jgi:hypothetical protein
MPANSPLRKHFEQIVTRLQRQAARLHCDGTALATTGLQASPRAQAAERLEASPPAQPTPMLVAPEIAPAIPVWFGPWL